MPRKIAKTSFNAGQLSPYIDSRDDIEKYYNGCSKLENGIVLPYGGFVKRSGLKYISTCKGQSRIIPFQFSTSDNMVIEMGANYFRFYKNDAYITITDPSAWAATTGYSVNAMVLSSDQAYYCKTAHTSGGSFNATNWVAMTASGSNWIYEIYHPYALADIMDIHYVQSGDVIYMAHEDYPVQKLSRIADNSWIIQDIDLEGGVFLDENTDDTKTLTFTHYEGSHITTGNSASLIVPASTFVANTLVGYTVYNRTKGSSGLITANTATGVTATLSGGTDWDIGDIYEIGISESFYHQEGAVGELTATGHTPFSANQVGSYYEMVIERAGDNYSQIIGAVASGYESQPIYVKGDYSITCSAFDTSGTTVAVYRKVNGQNWTEVRKFTSATSFSGTENEDNVQYKLEYTGSSTANASFRAILTIADNTEAGIVKIINYIDTSTVVVEVTKRLYNDAEIEDATYTSMTRSGTTVTVYSSTTVANGKQVIFKNITNSNLLYLNFNGTNVYTVSGSVASTSFNIVGANSGTLTSQTTGLGEFYVLGESVTTYHWSEGAWSGENGYPSTIGFYEDRLWLAGTTYQPQTLWASVSSDYENFTSGSNADDSLQFTINTGDSSAIQWIGSRELMFVGTSSGEFIISANNPDNPVTPTDIKVRDKSVNGSNHIQPKILNEALFFSQGQGRKLRALRFTLASEQYEADDVTILNNVILESPPVEFAIQKIPDSILWIVREDGGLVSFTYDPKEEVTAFAEHFTKTADYTLNSEFKSVCSIRGATEDEIFVVVKRYINSEYIYNIEKFSTRIFNTLQEATMVDCYSQARNATDPVVVVGASDTVLYGSGEYGSGYYGGIF